MLKVAAALAEGDAIDLADLPEAVQAGGAEPSAPGAADPILSELAACGGNVSELARRLGVDRSTVHRRLRRTRAN